MYDSNHYYWLARNIPSTLNSIDFTKLRAKRHSWFFKRHVIDALMKHQEQGDPYHKYFKDDDSNSRDYLFAEVRSASATVLDSPLAFPHRINRLMVANNQVGLAMSAPQKRMIINFYIFLLEASIPAIHVLLQPESYLLFDNIAKYYVGEHQYSLSSPETMREYTDEQKLLQVTSQAIECYDPRLPTQTQSYLLTIRTEEKKHQVKVLESNGWPDRAGLSTRQLQRLLEIRDDAFWDMSRSNILTHCLAGVGRTGTLLTAEAMTKLNTSLISTIIQLRDSRNCHMVQTRVQLDTLFHWATHYHHAIL